MEYYCHNCGKTISRAEFGYSKNKFDEALCMNCQEIRRTEMRRSDPAYTEEMQRTDSIVVIEGATNGIPKFDRQTSVEKEMDFGKWIEEWRMVRELDFSLESKHFFLGGSDLDDFTKQVIKMAEKMILVANPFLEDCYLTDHLIDSAANQTDITIVTRGPEEQKKGFAEKVACHSRLRNKGISIHYNSQVHSKIITVDSKVAVVSSMNFYAGSSGGASKEAGIVSIDQKVVESATNYIRKFLE